MSDIPLTPRSLELGERFAQIEEALTKVHGDKLAFSASCAAHLMILENVLLGILTEYAREEFNLVLFERDLEHLLMHLHKDVCEYLEVDMQKSLELSSHYNEVIRDILSRQRKR